MILLTCCVAVAPLLREVGLAVVLAVTIYLFSHRQFKWGATILLAAVVLSGLWLARNQFLIGAVPGGQSGNLSLLVQHFATPPDGSLAVELLLRMWLNVKRYALQAGGMILYPLFSTHQVNLIVEPSWYYRLFQDLFTVLQYLVTLVVAPLVLLGLYRDMKSSSSWGLRFMIAAGYLIAILVYPINDIRFLMPLIPFVILYAIKGTGIFREFVSDAFLFASKRMSVALAALVMIPNIAGMHEIVSTNQSYRDDPVGMAERLRSTGAYPPIFTQPWGLLGAWIRENVAEGEVIGTPSKELATVVGNRSVLELDPGVPLPMFESLLRDNRAGYLLAPVRWSDMKVYEFMMSESRRLSFTEVYSVANLHLYRVASRFTLPDSMRGASPAPIDTTTVTGLLRRGRTALIRGETGAALKDLAVAYASAPLQPDVAYQAIVGFSFAGDSARALDIYHNLMTLPQSGSYLFLSRVQLEIMARVKKAAAARMPEERVVRMFDAASEYWKLGYGNQAYRIMNEVVALDTNYLNGLLWALHFSLQNGDTARARADLGYLRHIDVANPVVQAFGTVLDLADSLRLTSKPKRRSQIHLSIAKVYRQIELKEEALDEALRAIGEEPGNTKAMMFVAECFEQKSRSLAALSMYSEVARRDPANPVARARADSLRSVRSAL
jgi:tetratricopeptide (TPR) repeat protein